MIGCRIRGRVARNPAATAVVMTEDVDTTGAATVVVAAGAGTTGAVAAIGVAAAEGAERSRQREGYFSISGRRGEGGFAGE